MGELLLDTLEQDDFADIMTLSSATESEARTMVDEQHAGLALIIPKDFTTILIGQGDSPTEIEFYKDPELSLGPQVVQSIVMSVVDGFSSGSLTLDTVNAVLLGQEITLTQSEQISLMQSSSAEMGFEEVGSTSSLNIISPATVQTSENQSSPLQTILRSIMAGMMIFYAFFTGTSAAQTILQEEENGTLARLFISPTSTATILNGKFLAGFLMIIVQVTVLLVFANLVFNIQWGALFPLILASIGLVALATSFGILVMSLVKGTKQAGIIYGAVLTFTGMLGISSVFVIGTPIEEAFNYLPLIVPQGWAMNAFRSSWQGNWGQTLINTAGMLTLAVAFFLIGNARFKKRFS
jgi:ABC-2 type transport system permease protein